MQILYLKYIQKIIGIGNRCEINYYYILSLSGKYKYSTLWITSLKMSATAALHVRLWMEFSNWVRLWLEFSNWVRLFLLFFHCLTRQYYLAGISTVSVHRILHYVSLLTFFNSFGDPVLTLSDRFSVLLRMSRGFGLYAIYSRALLNLAKSGLFEISSRMCQLIRLLQRVTHILSSMRPLAFVKIQKNERSRKNSDGKKNDNIVSKGCLPVYVGKDIPIRFVIDAKALSHQLFAELLEASAHEFGYEYKGALRIPCDVFLFERILTLINSRHPTLAISHERFW